MESAGLLDTARADRSRAGERAWKAEGAKAAAEVAMSTVAAQASTTLRI